MHHEPTLTGAAFAVTMAYTWKQTTAVHVGHLITGSGEPCVGVYIVGPGVDPHVKAYFQGVAEISRDLGHVPAALLVADVASDTHEAVLTAWPLVARQTSDDYVKAVTEALESPAMQVVRLASVAPSTVPEDDTSAPAAIARGVVMAAMIGYTMLGASTVRVGLLAGRSPRASPSMVVGGSEVHLGVALLGVPTDERARRTFNLAMQVGVREGGCAEPTVLLHRSTKAENTLVGWQPIPPPGELTPASSERFGQAVADALETAIREHVVRSGLGSLS